VAFPTLGNSSLELCAAVGSAQAEIKSWGGGIAWEMVFAEFNLQSILFTTTLQRIGFPYAIAPLSW